MNECIHVNEGLTDKISEKLNASELSFSFLKPGFIDCYEGVNDILVGKGLQVVKSKCMTLSPDVIDFIYMDCSDEHYYPVMRKYLSENQILAMLISGLGQDTNTTVAGLKKSVDGKDGIIRKRFQKDPLIDPGEIEMWQAGKHPRQDEITILLTQKNVLHTSDTAQEVYYCLRRVFGLNNNDLIHQSYGASLDLLADIYIWEK